MQMRCRVIKPGKYPVWGISFPKDIATFTKDIYYKIERSGTSLILTSGCKIEYNKEDLKDYKYEDCEI